MWSHHTLWLNALCMFADFSCMVSFHLSFAYGCGLQPAALEHLVRCAHSPLWDLGFCTLFFASAEWMVYTWSANHLERQYRPPPLLGGYLVQWPPRHYYQQRMDDSCPLQVVALCTSTSERTLKEAMFVGPCTVFVYDNEATHSASISMFHRMSWWIINFGMFLSVTQW